MDSVTASEQKPTKSEIYLFNFYDRAVRIVIENGQTEFVCRAVCSAIGIPWNISVLRGLNSDERGFAISSTNRGSQLLTTVTESGLHKILLRAHRKPITRFFQDWVWQDVLVELRKEARAEVMQH